MFTRSHWLTAGIRIFLPFLLLLAACASASQVKPTPTEEQEPAEEPARPSNAGGTGEAVNLTGNVQSGQEVFKVNCVVCHGDQGKGGVANPGSEDETVPELNPIDPTLKNADPKVYASNLDLFLEHGSTPAGKTPTLSMPAFGDTKVLTPQQIADVIAYVISLNP